MNQTVLAFIFLPVVHARAAELLFPNSDFEAGTLSNWTAAGTAFSSRQPTRGDNTAARGREPSMHQGNYWIGTFENYDGISGSPGNARGDSPTGTLTSAEFTIARRYITFRAGSGYLPGQTGIKLVCEGQEYLMANGSNNESMFPVTFDAAAFVGKAARIVIFDQATGGWGHINADEFAGSDVPAELGDGGFRLTPGIPAADSPAVGYNQAHRPQFHFNSRRNWLNDPNGMVFDGENYHLFFQHNPLGTGWGNMTWGHAISPDMIHWRQKDHALLPYQVDGRNGTIYSGTTVVDHNNSLGVQAGPRKTLVSFYTYAAEPAFYQAMAYSTDGGVTWQYHNYGRAILPNQGFDNGERDPKVFWHEETEKWVMVLWVGSNPGRIRFFTSANLKDWTFASDMLRDWAFECMDVFPAAVDGDPARTKWVIYDASFDYEIGTFDGTTFHTESGPFRASHGSFYAAQSFNQAPGGRTVQVGWMNGGPNSATAYGIPSNQQMSFPCDLSLRTTPAGVRLCAFPIPEISSLVTSTRQVDNQPITPSNNLLAGLTNLDLVDLSLEFDPGTATQVIIDLPRTSVRYQVATGELTYTAVDGNQATALSGPIPPRSGRVKIRLLLDRLSLEAYAFDGESFGTHYISPNNGVAIPSLRSVGGQANAHSLTVKSLASTWTPEVPLSTTLINPGFEEGIPSGTPLREVIPGWNSFGDWSDATGTLDDTGDMFPRTAGYPDFTGLGAASLKARNGTSEKRAGVFQSLGHVALADIGKTYTLGADLGARITNGNGTYSHSGNLTASFRKGVTAGTGGNKGTLLGEPGTRTLLADDSVLPALDSVAFARRTASFTPGIADVGTEVFAVIDLENLTSSPAATDGEKQYLADNITLSAGVAPPSVGPLAHESFDYPTGTSNLAGQYGGAGWATPWQTVDGGSADVTSGSLAATGSPPGFNLRSTGNSARLPNARRVGRFLDTSPNGPFAQRGYLDADGRIGKDGTTLYLSFLQKADGTSLFYELEFHRDNLGDPGRIAGIGNDRSGNNVHLRAPNDTHTLIGAGNTTVNFYVVRIDFKAGNDDIRIYRNITSATEPTVPTLLKTTATDMSLNGISFGAFANDRTVTHDEIRFAGSWSEALGISPFAAWAAGKGLDGSPAKSAAFGDDPDLDGMANGLEWILGGNPLSAGSIPRISANGTPASGLVLTFNREESSIGSSALHVQWSPDLGANWNEIPVGQSGTFAHGVSVSINETASPDLVTVQIPASAASGGKIFARLRAVLP